MIEEANLSDMITECEKFPYGSCGDASILLAQYLIDAGCESTEADRALREAGIVKTQLGKE